MLVSVRPAGGSAHLERLDLDTYRWASLAARPLPTGGTRFRLLSPGVYRVVVPEHRNLATATSRPVPFRAGAFRD